MPEQKPENNKPNPQDPNGNKPPVPNKPQSRGMFGFFAIMLMVLMLVMFLSSAEKGSELTFAEFETSYVQGTIKKDTVILRDSAITAVEVQPEVDANKTKDRLVRVPLNTGTRELYAAKLDALTNGKFKSPPPSGWVNFLYMFGPILLLIAIIWFMLARGMRAAGGGA
ncbi:MAG: hypothetical protein NXI07_10465, partial [bacterium]|nr:hypothetical protein [bacterium]